MDFDYKLFAELLADFVTEGGKIKVFSNKDITRVITPMCRFLRISKFVAVISDAVKNKGPVYAPFVYYDDGNSDEGRQLSIREDLVRGGYVTYSILPALGSDDWTETELEYIRLMEKQVYMFTDRGHMLKLLSDLTLEDKEFGLKSLTYLMTTANQLINHGHIAEYGAAFFNLRRFSVVNEKLGRNIGNRVMIQYAQGLYDKLDKDGCVCRVGGDNFAVLFLREQLDMVKKYLSGRYIIYGSDRDTVKVSASAGFYLIPEGTESASEIMDRASSACQLARNVYHRQFIFYDNDIKKQQEHVREIEAMFPKAIANEEFQVFYQPKTQLQNYHIAGAEALCRWFSNGRIVPPGDFIPILESSKAICTLDFYMLAHVCRDIRRWLSEGRDVVKVSVNLSRLHLGDEDLLDTIICIIDKYNVPHKYIEIELTETTTDVDYAELKKLVNGLREQGISTSVDDFGVGYSSLNLIREMPWNVLKIDKSFLPTHAENPDQSKMKMLRHIIRMSQDLGLECIVEGVETAEQVKLLKDCKCYLAQGFYFDRPLPVSEFEQRLDSNAV